MQRASGSAAHLAKMLAIDVAASSLRPKSSSRKPHFSRAAASVRKAPSASMVVLAPPPDAGARSWHDARACVNHTRAQGMKAKRTAMHDESESKANIQALRSRVGNIAAPALWMACELDRRRRAFAWWGGRVVQGQYLACTCAAHDAQSLSVGCTANALRARRGIATRHRPDNSCTHRNKDASSHPQRALAEASRH